MGELEFSHFLEANQVGSRECNSTNTPRITFFCQKFASLEFSQWKSEWSWTLFAHRR